MQAARYQDSRDKRKREQLRAQAADGQIAAFAVAAGLSPTADPASIVERIRVLRLQAQRAQKGARA